MQRGSGSRPTTAGGTRRRARFIPVRAGNTMSHFSAPDEAAVHPRTRGEHSAPPGAVADRDRDHAAPQPDRQGHLPGVLEAA